MNYSLTRKTKQPSRGHNGDAGIDIYVPQFDDKDFILAVYQLNRPDSFFMETSERKLYIMPHKRIKLPTGVYFNIPKNNMLLVLEKTSVPNKTGLISGARVIDENYQGEFIASIINTSDQQAYLQPGQKFIQVVLVPLYQDRELQQTQFEDLYPEKTTRGQGSFGSTGHF